MRSHIRRGFLITGYALLISGASFGAKCALADPPIPLTTVFPTLSAAVVNAANVSAAMLPVTVDPVYENLYANCRGYNNPIACDGLSTMGVVSLNRVSALNSQKMMNRMTIFQPDGSSKFAPINITNGVLTYDSALVNSNQIGIIDAAIYIGSKSVPFQRCDYFKYVCGPGIAPGSCPVSPAASCTPAAFNQNSNSNQSCTVAAADTCSARASTYCAGEVFTDGCNAPCGSIGTKTTSCPATSCATNQVLAPDGACHPTWVCADASSQTASYCSSLTKTVTAPVPGGWPTSGTCPGTSTAPSCSSCGVVITKMIPVNSTSVSAKNGTVSVTANATGSAPNPPTLSYRIAPVPNTPTVDNGSGNFTGLDFGNYNVAVVDTANPSCASDLQQVSLRACTVAATDPLSCPSLSKNYCAADKTPYYDSCGVACPVSVGLKPIAQCGTTSSCPLASLTVSKKNPTTGNSDGNFTVNASGAVTSLLAVLKNPPSAYSGTTSFTSTGTQMASPISFGLLPTGDYVVNFTDGNGCLSTQTVSLSAPAAQCPFGVYDTSGSTNLPILQTTKSVPVGTFGMGMILRTSSPNGKADSSYPPCAYANLSSRSAGMYDCNTAQYIATCVVNGSSASWLDSGATPSTVAGRYVYATGFSNVTTLYDGQGNIIGTINDMKPSAVVGGSGRDAVVVGWHKASANGAACSTGSGLMGTLSAYDTQSFSLDCSACGTGAPSGMCPRCVYSDAAGGGRGGFTTSAQYTVCE